MENSRRCDIWKIDVHRSSPAKHLRSKKHLENIKQDDMIIPDWMLQEPVVNIPRKICNPKPLKQIARENNKIDEEQLNKELIKKC